MSETTRSDDDVTATPEASGGPLRRVLKVQDLSVRTSRYSLLEGVSFTVDGDERVGLIGESGSGKSLTALSIMGLLSPGLQSSGSITITDDEVLGIKESVLARRRGKDLAMVFQEPMTALNPTMRVGAQIAETMLLHHTKPTKKAAYDEVIRLLERVGLPDPQRAARSYPHQLSGGQRQRAVIAIAMANEPALLICDEPTTALDVSIQAQILVEMKTLVREAGVGLVWISHDLATVSVLASRLLVMYAGRLIEEGPTAEVLRRPRHPYTQGLIDSLPSRAAPGRDLVQIPGSTPSLTSLPSGCAFKARCANATQTCNTAPERTFEDARAWRCHHPMHVSAVARVQP